MPRWLVGVVLAFVTQTADGQWLNYPTRGTPRTRGGKPNLTTPAPRASNGRPDLSGVWHLEPTPMAEMKRVLGDKADLINAPMSKYFLNILLDFKPEETPLRPEVQLRRPPELCLPVGIPMSFLVSEPAKIVQTPDLIVITYESDDTHRQILYATKTRKIAPTWNESKSNPLTGGTYERTWKNRYHTHYEHGADN